MQVIGVWSSACNAETKCSRCEECVCSSGEGCVYFGLLKNKVLCEKSEVQFIFSMHSCVQ